MKSLLFIANYNLTDQGMSGGDRIFIELIKNLTKSFKVCLLGSEEAIIVAKRNGVSKIRFFVTRKKRVVKNALSTSNIFVHTILKLLSGLTSLRKYSPFIRNADFIYSVSDFYPDLFPALYLKVRHKKMKWIAAFYMFAPKPWEKNNPYRVSISRQVAGFFYWFTQIFSYFLIRKFSDYVVVCNELDRKIFIKDGYDKNKIIAIYGGVNLSEVNAVVKPKKQTYDAVFMARFHSQKGPLTAVKAWETVLESEPRAKLAMIGNGPEEPRVSSYIKKKNLTKNIHLYGFVDGKEKYKILKSSKIFVHSSIYETGGMAAAEGMAAGLPVVAFDHEGFTYTYPKGLYRIHPIGSYKKMGDKIISLLNNKKEYAKLKKDAAELALKWDWKYRAKEIRSMITRSENV